MSTSVRLQTHPKYLPMKKHILPVIALSAFTILQSCYKDGPDYNWDISGENSKKKCTGDYCDNPPKESDPKEVTDPITGETTTIVVGLPTQGNIGADGTEYDMECPGGGSNCPEGAGGDPTQFLPNGSTAKALDNLEKVIDEDGDGKNDAITKLEGDILPAIGSEIANEVVNEIVDSEFGSDETIAEKPGEATSDIMGFIDTAHPSVSIDSAKIAEAIAGSIEEVFTEDSPSAAELANDISYGVKKVTEEVTEKYFADNPIHIDEEDIFNELQEAVAIEVQDVVQKHIEEAIKEAIIESLTEQASGLSSTEITEIAEQVAKEKSQSIAGEAIADIAKTQAEAVQNTIAEELFNLPSPPKVQGICPDGQFIPSDKDWKLLEEALGMPTEDLHASGIKTDRGRDAAMAEILVKELGVQYSGYKTEAGQWAQIGQAEVFASSSVGRDSKGDYMWVRYVDNLGDHQGIIRKKIYKGTTATIRCFKVQ